MVWSLLDPGNNDAMTVAAPMAQIHSDPQENLRILVLTSSTGGGHDARATAFEEWARLLYGERVEVRVEQMIEKASVIGRTGVNTYNTIQRYAPILHVPFYLLVEGLSILNSSQVSFGRAYYERTLREFRPHLVFSVHDCLNRGYFQLARRILGKGVRCATYCGEFSGGWGFSRNWVEPTADLFVARTKSAAEYAIKLGMPRNRVSVRGHFLAPRADRETLSPEGRRSYRRSELGLDPDRFTLLLATGGAGANNHRQLAPVLERLAAFVQPVFMCGRDDATRAWLEDWLRHRPAVRAHVVPYTNDVHLLMQACDAVFTRGGTTTCAKALHYNCPVLFNTFGGVMPQERLTLKYFLRGGARQAGNPREFGFILEQFRDDPESLPGLRSDFERLRYQSDTTEVIRDLVDLAAEAAGSPARVRADWQANYEPGPAFQRLAEQ